MRLLEIIATALERFIHTYTTAHLYTSGEDDDEIRDRIVRLDKAGHKADDDFIVLQTRLQQTERRLDTFHDALGGLQWQTATGHIRYIVNMSTGHLNNIIAGRFGSEHARAAIQIELDRRTNDDMWRERQTRVRAELDRSVAKQLSLTNNQDFEDLRAAFIVFLVFGGAIFAAYRFGLLD